MKTLHLDIQEPEIRIDLALLAELQKEAPHLSRAALKVWFKNDHVHLHGRPVQPSHLLRAGRYEITLLRWDDSSRLPPEAHASREGAFLPIVYEDDELLVLHKMTGIPSVPQDASETQTAVGAALAHLPGLKAIGRGGFEPAILHRLDTGTSGLLVFAKTEAEFERMRQLWSDGHVRKTYRALTRGGGGAAPGSPEIPKPHTPVKIDYPIGHDAKSAKRMIAILPDRERDLRGMAMPAITILEDFREISPGLHDLRIEIQTGVMHQIRCHLAAIGWPLLGDAIYRGVPSSRLWLHAWRLEIPLASGVQLKLEAALPAAWPQGRKTEA